MTGSDERKGVVKGFGYRRNIDVSWIERKYDGNF